MHSKGNLFTLLQSSQIEKINKGTKQLEAATRENKRTLRQYEDQRIGGLVWLNQEMISKAFRREEVCIGCSRVLGTQMAGKVSGRIVLRLMQMFLCDPAGPTTP